MRPKNTRGGGGGGERCQKDTTVPTKSDFNAISTKNSRISTILWQKRTQRGGGGGSEGVVFFGRNFSRLSFLNTSLKFHKRSLQILGPIDRTPGIPGSDKKLAKLFGIRRWSVRRPLESLFEHALVANMLRVICFASKQQLQP